jgi:uncharacterized RDD family membrane protein YckC
MQCIFLRRVAAFLLDIVVLFAVLGPLGFAVQFALGLVPSTPQQIYGTLLLNFSLPVWSYFAWADCSRRGATVGKRALSLHTESVDGQRVTLARAFLRTVVKMLPWETTHAAMFLFAPAGQTLHLGNWVGLGASYALSFAYLFLAWRTQGRRSVYDLVADTLVSADSVVAAEGECRSRPRVAQSTTHLSSREWRLPP